MVVMLWPDVLVCIRTSAILVLMALLQDQIALRDRLLRCVGHLTYHGHELVASVNDAKDMLDRVVLACGARMGPQIMKELGCDTSNVLGRERDLPDVRSCIHVNSRSTH